MTLQIKSILSLIIFITIGITSCSDGDNPNLFTDNFDRKAMLTDWADEFIIPNLKAYNSSLSLLKDSKDIFVDQPSESNLNDLRSAYILAYHAWQNVSMFDIGKAEEIGLINYSNIFPTNTAEITNNISDQNYNLELPSNFDAQGFPALDYIFYGIANSDSEILVLLSDSLHSKYLSDLVDRLYDLAKLVLLDWENGYRDTFINNDGASATASVDKMVNDFLFHYEKYFRAGKIGIPAGIFSGNTISSSVEAPYSSNYSKSLFIEAFDAHQKFFIGNNFDGTKEVISLKTYLLHIMELNQSEDIASQIINQWNIAKEKIDLIEESFKDQITNDNTKMLALYDELQKAVILLKVDMMQMLNIQVDYVDADGD